MARGGNGSGPSCIGAAAESLQWNINHRSDSIIGKNHDDEACSIHRCGAQTWWIGYDQPGHEQITTAYINKCAIIAETRNDFKDQLDRFIWRIANNGSDHGSTNIAAKEPKDS